MLLVLSGCAGGPKGPTAPTEKKPAVPEPITARTGKVEVTQKDEKGEVQWIVRANESEITYDTNGKMSGQLYDISADLHKEGRIACTITAKKAFADQAKNQLDVEDQVKVVDVKDGAVLTASKVSWLAGKKLVEASGNVKVVSKFYESGPFDRIWATPDLKDIGTPNAFAQEGKPK